MLLQYHKIYSTLSLWLQTLFKRLSLQLQLQNEGIKVREPRDV